MSDNLFVALIFNISLLVTAAIILTEFNPFCRLLQSKPNRLFDKLILALLFGVLTILSTYAGVDVMEAIINTRVITVAAAGILGGFLPGVGAGIIGGVHRYFYAPESFTALGCCIGTIAFGIVGALYHKKNRSFMKNRILLVQVTVICELLQAIILLLVARPISSVIELESIILIPKLIINSIGIILFFGVISRLQQSRLQTELRRKAELKALQSQMNPHFFCNALTTISALCISDTKKARHLLRVLADYYRQILSVNDDFVSLERELQNVDNYLSIAQARFEDAIHLEFDIMQECKDCILPPLIIQPLVENAVRHGGTTPTNRTVGLNISREKNNITVKISDKGHGFPSDVIKDLNDPENKRFTGLFNVSKRLRSIYGEECKLNVNSSSEGSFVIFQVPVRPLRVE